MIPYACSTFYLNAYGTSTAIPTDRFDLYAKKATMEIKRYIFDNLDERRDIPEEVQMCCCEIAELLYKEDKRQKNSGGLSSESVGGWSKSYESGEQAKSTLQSEIRHSVMTWLSGTGLLFAGVR